MFGANDPHSLPGVYAGTEQLEHKLLIDIGRHPRCTDPHTDLRSGQLCRLHSFHGGEIPGKRIFLFGRQRCLQRLQHTQLFAHIAGQKFLSSDIGICRQIKLHRTDLLRCKTATDIPVNDPGKLLHQLVLTFTGQLRHKAEIHLRFFGERYRQRLRCRIHLRDRLMRANGALGEHIRLAGEIAFVVQHLQRAQQRIAAVIRKGKVVATGVKPPVFFDIGIVQPVQLLLLAPDDLIGMVLRLVLDELTGAVPQGDHAAHSVLGGQRQFDRLHAAVNAEIQLAVYAGKAVITHIWVGGNG